MPRSPVIDDLLPEQTIQRRLAEAEERQRNRPRVSSGAPGAPGAEGPTGPEGRGPVGLRYKFSTSTTSSDPGSGTFRLNKNIITESPTQMYISETDADGGFAALYMVKWGVSTSATKGYIIMRKRGAPLTWALFSIQKQYTDNGTWDTFPELTKIAGEGTWSNGDEFYIDSIFIGDKGEKGETGTTGSKGETGLTGATGSPGGYSYRFSTNIEATNPGGKFLKYNNATIGSVTKIFISETELGGGNLAAAIQEWDDSTTLTARSLILIRSAVKPENFALFKVTTGITDNGEYDTVPVSVIASNGTFANEEQLVVQAFRTGDKGEKGEKGETGTAGTNGTNGLNGKGAWTPITDASIKEISPTAFEKITNVEGDATLRSAEGFTRGCYLTFTPATTTKGFGFGLNTDPATDEGFTGIDYWLNCTAAGSLLIRESGVEFATGKTYVAGDQLGITYDGHTVRYWKNGEMLRAVQRTIGSALYMDSWWNQEGGKAENVEFGPMSERGTDFGLPYIYSTTITEAAPGKGFFRFNNATLTSATSLYISRYMLPEVAIKGLINAWDDSTSTIHGILTFRKVGDPSAYLAYTVSGTVTEKESGEWLAITGLANVISNGTFSNNDEVQIEFERTGDKGTTGATGSVGPPAGIKLTYLTNTEETEPASGAVKFNSTTPASITRMFISEKEFAGNSILQVLETLVAGNETIRSYITVTQENDPTKWGLFFVIATREDKGEWEKFEIGFVAGTGGWENNQPVRLNFVKNGLRGEKGEKGAEGASGSTAYFRDVWTREGTMPAATAIGTYIMGNTALIAKGANTAVLGGIKYIDPTGDYPVTEKQARFRLKGEFATNATAPGLGKFRFSLRRVTAVAGAAGGITYTLGEPVLTTPFSEIQGASSQKLLTSVEALKIAEPAMYAMCIEIESAAIAASAFVGATCTLQVQNT